MFHKDALASSAFKAPRTSVEVIELFLDAGANPDGRNGGAFLVNPVESAAISNNVQALQRLHNTGAVSVESMSGALETAVTHGAGEAFRLLISYGVQIDAVETDRMSMAVGSGYGNVFWALLDAGYDVAEYGGQGFINAACRNAGTILNELIDRGADQSAGFENQTARQPNWGSTCP